MSKKIHNPLFGVNSEEKRRVMHYESQTCISRKQEKGSRKLFFSGGRAGSARKHNTEHSTLTWTLFHCVTGDFALKTQRLFLSTVHTTGRVALKWKQKWNIKKYREQSVLKVATHLRVKSSTMFFLLKKKVCSIIATFLRS